MGVNIHKIMGWGLTLPHTQFKETVRAADDFWGEDLSSQQYRDFLTQKYGDSDAAMKSLAIGAPFNMDAVFNKDVEKWSATNVIHTYNDFLLDGENVVIILPTQCRKNWFRIDNDIDYMEVMYSIQDDPEKGIENKLKWLKWNPYPFDGTYMNAKTGNQFSPKQKDTIRQLLRVEESLKGNIYEAFEKEPLLQKLDEFGFTSWEDFKQNLAPNVPMEIRDICEWSDVFTDNQIINNLRPVILEGWR